MNNKKQPIEDTIDLLDLARKLLRYWWIMLLALVIGAGGAYVYTSKMVTPMYQAEAMLYVNNGSITLGSDTVSLQDLNASESLVDSYIVIMESRNVLMDVAEQLGLNYSYSQMKGMVSASKVSDTQVFSLYVTSADPEEAKLIVNSIAEILPEKFANIVEGGSVKVVDYANQSSQRVSPNIKKNTLMGGLALFVIATAVLVLRILLDNTIQDKTDIYDLTKASILAQIPYVSTTISKSENTSEKRPRSKAHSRKKDSSRLRSYEESSMLVGNNLPFATKEAYRLLKTNVLYSMPHTQQGKIIGITSSVAAEYKSTVAMNLAVQLAADTNKKVLLLDCDLRMSEIRERLHLEEKAGLTEYLTTDTDLSSLICRSAEYPGFDIIISGGISPNPGDLLSSQNMVECLQTLRKDYDFIVCDFPPTNIVSDALELGKYTDGMLVVARQKYTVKGALEEALRKLKFLSINVIGIVITGVEENKSYSRKYYYSKYNGSYTRKFR